MNESVEARALRLEQERTERRIRDAINNIHLELATLQADPSRSDRARQVVTHAADLAQATARLETLQQYGNLAPTTT